MYLLASQLKSFAIISLQTGASLADVTDLVISRDKLEVLAYRCEGGELASKTSVLLTRDIRQYAQGCLIVDTANDISDVDDIVRLRESLEQNFHLMGLAVITESKRKLGKVQDYSINIQTNMVQRLDVKQPLFRNFLVESLSIDRQDILDITAKYIVVRDASVKAAQPSVVPVTPTVHDRLDKI